MFTVIEILMMLENVRSENYNLYNDRQTLRNQDKDLNVALTYDKN